MRDFLKFLWLLRKHELYQARGSFTVVYHHKMSAINQEKLRLDINHEKQGRARSKVMRVGNVIFSYPFIQRILQNQPHSDFKCHQRVCIALRPHQISIMEDFLD